MNKRDMALVVVFAVLLVTFNSFFILAASSSGSFVKDSGSKSISLNSVRVLDSDDNDADEDDESLSVEQLQLTDGLITRAQAEDIAIEEVGGRVVGFESERENGRITYDIELIVSGEEVEVEIDARTGEILEIEYGDDD